jgi:ATP-dependent Clp protease ATP-binding subunit ClpB
MAATRTIHLDRYAPDARAIIAGAQHLADERQHVEVEPIHLLHRAVDRDRGVAEVFKRAGAEPSDLLAEADSALRRLPKTGKGEAYLSVAFIDLLSRAEREAERDRQKEVTTENVLNALSQEIRGAAGAVLQAMGIGPGALRPHLPALHQVPRDLVPVGNAPPPPAEALARATVDLVEKARKDDEVVIGRDVEIRRILQVLERRSKSHALLVGEPGVGKSAIVRAVAKRIATGEVPSNLKKARLLQLDLGNVVAGAKLRGEVEERLRAVLVALREGEGGILHVEDLAALFGGGPGPGGIGELLKPVLARGEIRILASTSPDGLRRIQEKESGVLRLLTVLPVEAPDPRLAQEIVRGVAVRYEKQHGIEIGEAAIRASVAFAKRYVQERALPDSALDLLDEAAARKRVELEGLSPELDAKIRRIDSLRAQMAALEKDEDRLSRATHALLSSELAKLEPEVAGQRAQATSRRSAIAAAEAIRSELRAKEKELEVAKAAGQYARLGELEHVTLPDLRRRLAAADEAITRLGNGPANVVGEDDVARIVEDWTGIPAAKMLEGEAEKLLKMADRLGERVVGQDEAVRAVTRAVRRGRVGLRDPGKPIGSFLFLGPSGVGKTELAKALAEFLFDDEAALTRLDMSEFMEKHMAQRLLGAPPGYVDSEEGGFLTEAVRRRPYSVLLFDEVEKGHPDVFNLLLQILDDGRLTDGRGRMADFSNTVVIMTSNIGSQRILETDGKVLETDAGREALKDVLRDELRNFFRPEFLNRIDDVVVFRALAKADLEGIAKIQLRRLQRLLDDKELKIELAPAAIARLVDLGYEPGFGARPLRRAIVREIQDPLAEELLRGGYPPGTTIEVDVEGEDFTFAKA